MKTDKELAMQLVDSLEEYYLRYTLLETILDAAKVPGWRQRCRAVLKSGRLGIARFDLANLSLCIVG